MKQHVSYRNFTLCKAGLLAGLIGLAALLGEVPRAVPALADTHQAVPSERVMPAAFILFGKSCDDQAPDMAPEKASGVAL